MTGKKRMILAYSIMLGGIVVSANATVIALHYTNNSKETNDHKNLATKQIYQKQEK